MMVLVGKLCVTCLCGADALCLSTHRCRDWYLATTEATESTEMSWLGQRFRGKTPPMPWCQRVHAMGSLVTRMCECRGVSVRSFPGTYATGQLLPILGVHHESLATEDAMWYVQTHGSSDSLQATRRLLYARYGMEAGGNLGGMFSVEGNQLGGDGQVIGAAGGHIAAGIQNQR